MHKRMSAAAVGLAAGLLAVNVGEANPGDLGTRLRCVIAEHRRLWLARCREGGLSDSCRYYEAVAEELEGAG